MSLFGKYWFVKNERNDDDVKMMRWLMTGGDHGTIDICGENSNLNCDEIYYGLPKIYHLESERECIRSGRLMDAGSIDTPAKLSKLELGIQIPIKSPFKLQRDVLKAVQKNGWGKNSPESLSCSCYWMNKTSNVVVNEYCDVGPIEFALPNSKTGFFDEFVIQKVYGKNPDGGK